MFFKTFLQNKIQEGNGVKCHALKKFSTSGSLRVPTRDRNMHNSKNDEQYYIIVIVSRPIDHTGVVIVWQCTYTIFTY